MTHMSEENLTDKNQPKPIKILKSILKSTGSQNRAFKISAM